VHATSVTRGHGDDSPLTTAATFECRRRSDLAGAAVRAEGGEKEPQVGLVAPEDGRPTEAEAMILTLTPDEALVVYGAYSLYYFDKGKGWARASPLFGAYFLY